MIYIPEKGVAYPNDPKLEIYSQLVSTDKDPKGNPISYIEVYRKHCDCDDERCRQDKFKVVWHNDEVHEDSDWDERDIIDTISVLASALSIEAQEKNNI